MRIAVVSDIHENRTGFEAVLADIRISGTHHGRPERACAMANAAGADAGFAFAVLFDCGAGAGAIGLFGVLNYLVTQQRREIGIRMAFGARPAQVVRVITSSLLGMVSLDLFLGLAGGVLCGRFVESLLFEVKRPIQARLPYQ